jgi:cytochrome P450
MGVLDSLVERIIEQRAHETAQQGKLRCDVLSLLRSAGFEGKPLRDHVMTMLIAGHETTGTALSFLWAHVAREPAIQAALTQESNTVDPDAIDLESIPFAEACWRETLRLYPSVPVLDRLAVDDTELGGYRIPQGANVLWSPFVMHRMPQHWPTRRDPNAFDPQGFVDDPAPDSRIYIPFGEGPRMCLGKSLADMEALVIIALFAQTFHIEPAEPGPVRMRTLVTLRPRDGVLVQMRARALASATPELAPAAC